ncbi:unnamed protein product [Lupinus luteus]|uniref:FAF domain-containing protein n=1 Tax=Lupinus luteus TaxID=3873 RepID=A0AAV1WPJ1_LUPLU
MVEIVSNGLQSCLESQLVDKRMHSLSLHSPKLLTPHQPIHIPIKSCLWEPNPKLHCEENIYTIHHSNPNNNQNGWSFVEDLSNVCIDRETASAYVHPEVKYSSVILSPKSMEICTENLGNETGSDDMMDNEIKLLSSCLWECGERREKKKGREVGRGEKEKRKNLPPPLRSIRGGSESLKMIARREGGRLVIEFQRSVSCFQAERIHGRLRLSFLEQLTKEEEEDESEGFEL